jgi:SAM-dependent methyltransferase
MPDKDRFLAAATRTRMVTDEHGIKDLHVVKDGKPIPTRLNCGAGMAPMRGYINLDVMYMDEANIRPLSKFDVVLAVGMAFPLAWPDSHFEEVRASHILEHYPHGGCNTANVHCSQVLREWVRVLRPEGILKVAVPDYRKIATWYLEGRDDPKLMFYLFGSQADEFDYHYNAFDEEGLTAAFAELGLTDIKRWESDAPDCSSLEVSLNLQGMKPSTGVAFVIGEVTTRTEVPEDQIPANLVNHPDPRYAGVEMPEGSIAAVMTTPRYGPTAFHYAASNALRLLNIPLISTGGAFWHQGIYRATQQAIETFPDVRYILTIDYDTIFDHRDIEALYGLMEHGERLGALCPVQHQRETGRLLIAVNDGSGNTMAKVTTQDFGNDVFKINSGHFGLTILRRSCLDVLPKPWFTETPDKDGGFGDGRVDMDISFWYKMQDAGFEIYQANRVVVGHLEDVITWPSAQMTPVIQPVSEYQRFGKPGRDRGLWR